MTTLNIYEQNTMDLLKYLVSYNMEDILTIQNGKMTDFHTADDIAGNGYKKNDPCLYILFKDGSVATFRKVVCTFA